MITKLKNLFIPPSKRRHALVGPLHLWEMKRDFQINFLKQVGLLPRHYLMDIGCGTLRGGIPLISYLQEGHYFGLESRRKVLEEGRKELYAASLAEKAPILLLSENFRSLELNQKFDFFWAFSVFIHMPDSVLSDCLHFVNNYLKTDGNLYANVNIGNKKEGCWQGFPINYRSIEFYRQQCLKNGLEMTELGCLKDLGHVSGVEAQDAQIMLKISKPNPIHQRN